MRGISTGACQIPLSCGRSSKLMPAKEWHWSSGVQSKRTPVAASAAAAPVQSPTLRRNQSMDRSSALALNNIREALIRQEDTIIFSLIERSQFAYNKPVYEEDGVPVPGFSPSGKRYSPLEYLLRETEQLHGKIRRFTSPDEHPFYPDTLPALVLPPMTYPEVLAPYSKEVNVNARVMEMYVGHLLPNIAAPGDDNNYGSSAMYDVLALQALSKRVHYGKFVAEAKFLAQRQEYTELISRQDSAAIMDLLTNKAVEKQVIARVRRKAAMLGQDYTAEEPVQAACESQQTFKVDPDTVAELFQDWVMPLTKDVEVLYLLRRLEWEA